MDQALEEGTNCGNEALLDVCCNAARSPSGAISLSGLSGVAEPPARN
jgi:hypothetical protein